MPDEPIQGDPAQPVVERPQATQGVNVRDLVPLKYGGKEYTAPPEVAEAWQQREQEFQQKLSEHSNELGELRRWRQQVQQTVQPQQAPSQGPDLNTLWFTDPVKAAQLVQQDTLTKANQMYQMAQAEQHFWNTFYSGRPDGRDFDRLAKSLATDHFQDLMRLPTVEQRAEKLWELTDKETLRLTRRIKTDDTKPTPRLAERASGDRVPEPATEDKEEQQLDKQFGGSLSSALRARAKQRTAKAAGV